MSQFGLHMLRSKSPLQYSYSLVVTPDRLIYITQSYLVTYIQIEANTLSELIKTNTDQHRYITFENRSTSVSHIRKSNHERVLVSCTYGSSLEHII